MDYLYKNVPNKETCRDAEMQKCRGINLVFQECFNVDREEILYRYASRTNNQSVWRSEPLCEHLHPVVRGATTAFHLNGYATAVVLYDEINLIVSLEPIIQTKVQLSAILSRWAPITVSTHRPQTLGVVKVLAKVVADKALSNAVL